MSRRRGVFRRLALRRLGRIKAAVALGAAAGAGLQAVASDAKQPTVLAGVLDATAPLRARFGCAGSRDESVEHWKLEPVGRGRLQSDVLPHPLPDDF